MQSPRPRNSFDRMQDAARSGDWPSALREASRFTTLGADKPVVSRAYEAAVRPAFYLQIGKDPAALIEAGVEVLRRRYTW